MIQHMNLVFGAEGLNVGEGAFLMACANHTDAKGYVIASMQQLADEAHMSLRSARDQKSRLVKRKLLLAKPRFNPKNGAQIANLFRMNLVLLERMQRARKDYGPTLVEELTFGEPPAEKTRSAPPADSAPPPARSAAPPADLAPPPAKSAGDGDARSAALLLPSSSPSSLSGDAPSPQTPPGPGAAETGERETPAPTDTPPTQQRAADAAEAAPEETTAASSGAGQESDPDASPVAGPEVPGPREEPPPDASDVSPQTADAARAVVESYVAACGPAGVVAIRPVRERLLQQARELLGDGCPAQWLADRAAEMPGKRWTDLALHAQRSKVPMTAAGAAPRRAPDPHCPTCHGSGKAEDPVTFRPLGPCSCLGAAPAAAGR